MGSSPDEPRHKDLRHSSLRYSHQTDTTELAFTNFPVDAITELEPVEDPDDDNPDDAPGDLGDPDDNPDDETPEKSDDEVRDELTGQKRLF